MPRMQVVIIVSAIVGAGGGAAAQNALSDTPQAKVAAPAATPAVRAGGGGGAGILTPDDGRRFCALREVGRTLQSRTIAWPRTGSPSGPLPAGVQRGAAVLTGPDGRTSHYQWDSIAPLPTIASSESLDARIAYFLQFDGEGYTARVAIGRPSGEIVDLPPIRFPFDGREQTVTVPGGGTLTLTLSEPPSPVLGSPEDRAAQRQYELTAGRLGGCGDEVAVEVARAEDAENRARQNVQLAMAQNELARRLSAVWPSAENPAPATRRTIGRLTRPDGTVIEIDTRSVQVDSPNGQTLPIGGAGSLDQLGLRLVRDGEGLRLFSAVSLIGVGVFSPSPMVFPAAGGTQTIDLAGGGSLTLTLIAPGAP